MVFRKPRDQLTRQCFLLSLGAYTRSSGVTQDEQAKRCSLTHYAIALAFCLRQFWRAPAGIHSLRQEQRPQRDLGQQFKHVEVIDAAGVMALP
ncbi:hypothetical protein RN02_12665 [Pseudomonas sp. PI1]|nr:hypothetical protein RN02_12665 [Pseudomonas sp. PI1]